MIKSLIFKMDIVSLQLLPMPRSWPVNPDESFMQLKENEIDDGVEENTNLRGNLEWAPPRPQIVFAVYSSPK